MLLLLSKDTSYDDKKPEFCPFIHPGLDIKSVKKNALFSVDRKPKLRLKEAR